MTLSEAAEKQEGRIATAFVSLVSTVQSQLPLKALATAIQLGDSVEVFRILDLKSRMQRVAGGAGLKPDQTSFQEALQAAFNAGIDTELENLGKVPSQKRVIGVRKGVPPSLPLPTPGKPVLERFWAGNEASTGWVGVEKADPEPFSTSIGVQVSLNRLNPEAVAWLQNYTFALIREVSDEAIEAVRDTILEAFREGGHPYEQARTIRNVVGLTRSQAAAVRNFRRMLESQAFDQALTRELRDKRFDPTLLKLIQSKQALSKGRIDQMTERYYQRYLKYRAEMISRTESLRASNSGQNELWRQAADQGLLDRDRGRRMWVVARDERLCEICREIPRMNPDGVKLGETFKTSRGPIEFPPAHVSCRCTCVIRFKRREAVAA